MSFIKSLKPQANSKFHQGYYSLINPLKYIGDDKRIIYRSSLELKFCQHCDLDPSILRWISEPDFLKIGYVNPFKRRMAVYYPDFYIKYKSTLTANGIDEAVIELKAHSMMYLEKNVNIAKMSIFRKRQFILNQRKKEAAEKFCASKGLRYLVITEKSDFFKRKGN